MNASLQRMITERLRPAGFVGSYPHLRRHSAGRIDLISFQFFSSGGSFAVEVACVPPDGTVSASGARVAPARVRARDVGRPRPRLGSEQFPSGDHWFHFGPRTYESAPSVPVSPPDAIASHVADLIEDQAEAFWAVNPFPGTHD